MPAEINTMEELIPVNSSLDKLYPLSDLLEQGERWNKLRELFIKTHGHDAEFVARCPGRVNIIGEHIDYSLFDALPMGIAADCIIAVSSSPATAGTPPKINLTNLNSKKFPSHEYTLEKDGSVEIDASTHAWTNYFKAGLKGALEHLQAQDASFAARNLNCVIDGTVPAGGGLSSSAAMVCASALASLHAHAPRARLTKHTLVDLAVASERSVGVNSGGLDQAASVCSIKGDALHVAFHPELAARAIAFPDGSADRVAFMIAQSFVAADKHVTGPVCYNLRVVEVTLAAEVLAAKLGLQLAPDKSSLGRSLRGLQDAYFASGKAPADVKTPAQEAAHMLSLVEKHLPDEGGYDREAIAGVLGISVPQLEERYMTTFPVRADKFRLRQRAQHVFSEVGRVLDFIQRLADPPELATPEASVEYYKGLGELMNKTQESCRDVYDCSCPELDDMCAIARKAGSYGSRLTGAGWGGCSVHLVPKDKVDAVRKAWVEEYYKVKFKGEKWLEDDDWLKRAVVVTEPGHGAMVIES